MELCCMCVKKISFLWNADDQQDSWSLKATTSVSHMSVQFCRLRCTCGNKMPCHGDVMITVSHCKVVSSIQAYLRLMDFFLCVKCILGCFFDYNTVTSETRSLRVIACPLRWRLIWFVWLKGAHNLQSIFLPTQPARLSDWKSGYSKAIFDFLDFTRPEGNVSVRFW